MDRYHPKIGSLVSSKVYPTKQRPWFVQASTPGVKSATWTDPYIFTSVETNVGVTACQPIFSSNGNLLGVAAVDMAFSQLSTDLRAIPFTPSGFAFIFNSAGVFYGSSVKNETVSFNSYDAKGNLDVELKDIHNITDWRMNTAAITIYNSVNGKLTSLEPIQTYVVGGLIFQHQLFKDPFGLNLVIVTGATSQEHLIKHSKLSPITWHNLPAPWLALESESVFFLSWHRFQPRSSLLAVL
ncbi:hypothetical protein BC830DRAFT_866669 [Chytriomyces sp. MP71]|nr:hypothetical protein BC830DRAFT_866669 [Chytriomyces sp. MP71]